MKNAIVNQIEFVKCSCGYRIINPFEKIKLECPKCRETVYKNSDNTCIEIENEVEK